MILLVNNANSRRTYNAITGTQSIMAISDELRASTAVDNADYIVQLRSRFADGRRRSNMQSVMFSLVQLPKVT